METQPIQDPYSHLEPIATRGGLGLEEALGVTEEVRRISPDFGDTQPEEDAGSGPVIEPRGKYEWRNIIRRGGAGLVSTGAIGTILYFLFKQPGKEETLQNVRVEGWANDLGWVFEGGGFFRGGKQVVNMLEAAKSIDINYNDRETWGYKTGVTGKFWKGGNNFGEKARIVVVWSEKLKDEAGRRELMETAGTNNAGILKFDELMVQKERQLGRKTEWTEVEQILKENFGFEQRYLDVVRELRVEYFTGEGKLREAIEAANKTSALEKRVAQEERTDIANSLLAATGASSQVDAETAMQIALVIPSTYSLADTYIAMGQIVPEMGAEFSRARTALTGTPQADIWIQQAGEVGHAMINPALGFAITIGYLAREGVPAIGKWAKNQLEGLAVRHPKIHSFLIKHRGE